MAMNDQPTSALRCTACRSSDLVESTYVRRFSPNGREVPVTLLTSRCPQCGAERTSNAQHKENLAKLRARKSDYGHLLMGEEISAFRRRYGLTQRAAAKIFGKGLIAFSRYENEASYPDSTTTKLLKQAIARPEVLKALADEEAVEIPLWTARCAEERSRKRATFTLLSGGEAETANWAQLQQADRRKGTAWSLAAAGGALRWQQTQLADLPSNDGSIEEVSAS